MQNANLFISSQNKSSRCVLKDARELSFLKGFSLKEKYATAG